MSKPKDLVNEAGLQAKVVSMTMLGMSPPKIAGELKISDNTVRRLLRKPEAKAMMESVKDAALSDAKNLIKFEMSKLAHKIMDVIHMQLAEGNLDAVKVGLKIIGFNDQETQANQSSNITVVMPGVETNTKTVIEVPNE